ncbi:uncharacterized protein LOC122562284 isoform X3 [Chiloscyllium plagiosum]|uniref:uncharacterized protein LOC122562284 isoform X3 n=1 Tax=Chiloscyllium plagiosum TaxID=36176 RepID=UPI001CB8562E|nr:uncharacterized protein LOC122562284 isoform X3 [Chiloscyllium plagiosum]
METGDSGRSGPSRWISPLIRLKQQLSARTHGFKSHFTQRCIIWVLVLGSQAPVARHFWKKQRRCTLPISTVSSFPPCRGGLGERDPGWETLETRRDKVG